MCAVEILEGLEIFGVPPQASAGLELAARALEQGLPLSP